MMMIVWLLWALQLSGIIAMEYGKLWLITGVCFAVGTFANMIKIKTQEKLVQVEIDKCGDVKDSEAVPTLLLLILRKIAMK